MQNAKMILFFLWKRLKSLPYLKKVAVYIYYFIYGTRIAVCDRSNYINIVPDNKFSFLKKDSFIINGINNQIIIKDESKITNTQFKINGNNNTILIDEKCYINNSCVWIESNHSQIKIGSKTSIAEATIGVAEPKSSITIGKNCMFAHDIDIRCGDSHSVIDLKSGARINHTQNIVIKDSVWLAAGVKILKSITIGSGSIIGAGSIVTKNISKNSLAVGIPALVKKTNVTWLKEKLPLENSHTDNLAKINTYHS